MAERRSIQWARAITWGAYLACSWTWCIGMFLPLLLVRDHGAPGWWAFAIPNVVGAAAMGWVLRSSLAASRLRAGHLAMGRVFSLVTIAFHAFFIAWMGGSLFPVEVLPLVVLVVGVVATGCLLLRAGVRWAALALWVGSAGVLVMMLTQGGGRFGASVAGTLSARGELPPTDVLWLTPVCMIGFALCPYLDLTFLRVRRICEGATGAAAFTLGFGVMFAGMIVLTLAYAGMFAPDVLSLGIADRPLWAVLCVAHIALQSGFTIGVHLVELATPEGERRLTGGRAFMDGGVSPGARDGAPGGVVGAGDDRPMPLGKTMLLIAMVFAALLGASAQTWPPLGPMPAGEVAYRCFMAFYGLVAPAYVWVCVIPSAGGGGAGRHDAARIVRPSRRSLVVFGIAVALASPFFALGFLWRETIWLAPGVAIVMLARLLLGARARGHGG